MGVINTVFTIGKTILQEERVVPEKFSTVGTQEALRVEMFPDGIQTILKNMKSTRALNMSHLY